MKKANAGSNIVFYASVIHVGTVPLDDAVGRAGARRSGPPRPRRPGSQRFRMGAGVGKAADGIAAGIDPIHGNAETRRDEKPKNGYSKIKGEAGLPRIERR